MDKFSYSLGVILAQNLKNQDITTFYAADLANGIEDVINGNQPKVSIEEANQLIQEYLQKVAMTKHQPIIEAGTKFLKENASRDEVTTLPSGLQYEVLNEGEGASPSATDQVTTHYHGTLIDGTKFDSSVERGEPATFPVNGVIPGWTEALQLMKEGSKWRLFLPPNLAYGERGAGEVIKPFATLVFEVELLSVN